MALFTTSRMAVITTVILLAVSAKMMLPHPASLGKQHRHSHCQSEREREKTHKRRTYEVDSNVIYFFCGKLTFSRLPREQT